MKGFVASVCLVASSDAAVLRSSNLRSQAQMQPEVVAQTFAKVEDTWRSEALAFAECNATQGEDCSASTQRFVDSCATLVGAVVRASSGDRSVVREYMGDICAEPVLDGRRRLGCTKFATALTSAMDLDSFTNREGMKTQAMCASFWSRFSAEERVQFDKERAEREVEERKVAEERAQQEAADSARMAKEAEEQRKVASELAAEAEAKGNATLAESDKVSSPAEVADIANTTEAATAQTNLAVTNSSDAASKAVSADASVAVETSAANTTEVNAVSDQIAAGAATNSSAALVREEVASNGTLNETAVPEAPVVKAVDTNSSALVAGNSTEAVNVSVKA
jgi:hypothetical protein